MLNKIGGFSKDLLDKIPEPIRTNVYLKAFGLLKVPVIHYLGVKVVETTPELIRVKIPLTRRSKNHLNSLYFGSLCVGADVAGGILAVRLIEEKGVPIQFVFKDLKAQFLKRAEGDTYFESRDGEAVTQLVERALQSGQRENLKVKVVATVPSKLKEPVAEFELTLSIKKKA